MATITAIVTTKATTKREALEYKAPDSVINQVCDRYQATRLPSGSIKFDNSVEKDMKHQLEMVGYFLCIIDNGEVRQPEIPDYPCSGFFVDGRPVWNWIQRSEKRLAYGYKFSTGGCCTLFLASTPNTSYSTHDSF